eukprot:311379-Chlamydomonas_euryale.AAC.3
MHVCIQCHPAFQPCAAVRTWISKSMWDDLGGLLGLVAAEIRICAASHPLLGHISLRMAGPSGIASTSVSSASPHPSSSPAAASTAVNTSITDWRRRLKSSRHACRAVWLLCGKGSKHAQGRADEPHGWFGASRDSRALFLAPAGLPRSRGPAEPSMGLPLKISGLGLSAAPNTCAAVACCHSGTALLRSAALQLRLHSDHAGLRRASCCAHLSSAAVQALTAQLHRAAGASDPARHACTADPAAAPAEAQHRGVQGERVTRRARAYVRACGRSVGRGALTAVRLPLPTACMP